MSSLRSSSWNRAAIAHLNRIDRAYTGILENGMGQGVFTPLFDTDGECEQSILVHCILIKNQYINHFRPTLCDRARFIQCHHLYLRQFLDIHTSLNEHSMPRCSSQ